MSLLLDKLSTKQELSSVLKRRIGDIEFNTDFRIGILFEMLMQDKNLKQETKVIQAIKLFYPHPEQIKNVEKAFDDIIWFYTCGKNEFNDTSDDNKKKSKQQREDKIYDYEYDDQYILSAFIETYQMDLQEIDYLHWWKFKSMFNSLNKNTKFVEIMGYRAIDLSKIKDKEEKARYKKLKKIYKLPDMRTEAQKESDFGNAFW
jgi:hypothetical protein